MSIYFISGASGSGKSSIIPDLQKLLGKDFVVFEFDSIGVPKDADTQWRQQTTEQWLRKILEEEKNVTLVGQMAIGELLACPSALKIQNINYYFLDVQDKQRVERLKQRGDTPDKHTLAWADWLRKHHKDPAYKQHVIKDNCWSELDFSLWDTLTVWNSKANIMFLDTTGLSINEVALEIAKDIKI